MIQVTSFAPLITIGTLEKLQKFRYVDPESNAVCVASWSGLISVYRRVKLKGFDGQPDSSA